MAFAFRVINPFSGALSGYILSIGILLINANTLLVTGMETILSCSFEDTFHFRYFPKAIPIRLDNVAVCDVLTCPSNCSCTLGNRKFWINCDQGEQNETFAEITFPPNIRSLYLSNILLNYVNLFSFKGIDEDLNNLLLNGNRLHDLIPGVFDGLLNLRFLYLYGNNLSLLQYGIFKGLDSLIFLDLRYNYLRHLEAGVFQDLSSLFYLYLDYNRLKTLKSGTFLGLRYIRDIDIDNNNIYTIDPDVFRGLGNLIQIDLDGNCISDLDPKLFYGLTNLKQIELHKNKFTKIPNDLFTGLNKMRDLTLSYNNLSEIELLILQGLNNLKELYLSYNNLSNLHPSLFTETRSLRVLLLDHNPLITLPETIFANLTDLTTLSLASVNLSFIPALIFKDLHSLRFLNMSGNNLFTVPPNVFITLNQIMAIDITVNSLKGITKDSFQLQKQNTFIYVDDYAACCFMETTSCSFKFGYSSFITCGRLLPYYTLQIFIWVVSIGSIVGNSYVLFTRLIQNTNRVYVQSLLITNLSFSDLLMGFYLLILLSVDIYFTQFFPSYSEFWRQTIFCKIAGALSLLSSEASVFFITLISIDRYLCLSSATRLDKVSARIAAILIWFAAIFITIVSVIILIFYPELYDNSEVCVGLPISRVYSHKIVSKNISFGTFYAEQDDDVGHFIEAVNTGSQPSYYFSIAIFTGLNFLCFLVVAFCYISIFRIANRASRTARVTNQQREIRRAFKMAAIVITDFCFWMAVIILSILVQSKAVTIDPDAYVWMATVALPINSLLNPFLYTFSMMISKRCQNKVEPSTATSSNASRMHHHQQGHQLNELNQD